MSTKIFYILHCTTNICLSNVNMLYDFSFAYDFFFALILTQFFFSVRCIFSPFWLNFCLFSLRCGCRCFSHFVTFSLSFLFHLLVFLVYAFKLTLQIRTGNVKYKRFGALNMKSKAKLLILLIYYELIQFVTLQLNEKKRTVCENWSEKWNACKNLTEKWTTFFQLTKKLSDFCQLLGDTIAFLYGFFTMTKIMLKIGHNPKIKYDELFSFYDFWRTFKIYSSFFLFEKLLTASKYQLHHRKNPRIRIESQMNEKSL